MKHIVIHECYDNIGIGESEKDLTNKEVQELEKYIKEKELDIDNIKITRNEIRFINYVGYIKLSTVAIEILPKINIDKNIDEDKKILLRMLVKSRYLNIKYSNLGMICKYNISLEEIFIGLLSEMIKRELNRGIYSSYIIVNKNINKLKGKLDLKNQLKNKINNSAKIYCAYDEFSINNELNVGLVFIINSLLKITKNNHSIKALNYSKNILGDVSSLNLTKEQLNLDFNRLNKRFEEIFILARMILNNESTTGKKGKEKGFSFLIKMNEVFELYIGRVIKEMNSDYEVYLQHKKYKLLINQDNDSGNFNLIPDIVLAKEGKEEIIIDTKWKRISRNYSRNGVKREDLYQMYAYLTRYKDVERCILLYPYNDEIEEEPILTKWYLEENKNKTIEVLSIDLSDEKNIKENIKRKMLE